MSKKYRTDPRSVPRYFSEERYRTAIHFQTEGKEWDRNGNLEKYRTDPFLLVGPILPCLEVFSWNHHQGSSLQIDIGTGLFREFATFYSKALTKKLQTL